jgi:prepilin-type N-terminal cleavage/methylation domain-containing protein
MSEYSFRYRRFPSYYKHSGFSLVELIVTLSVVAILLYLSALQINKRLDDMNREILQFQAHAFKRTIDNVQAISVLQGGAIVDMGTGTYVFINTFGWPYAAAKSPISAFDIGSDASCRSLWQLLFTNRNEQNDNARTNVSDDLGIQIVDDYICRYKQFGEQEESNFFDYDVRTGRVVTSPDTN